MRFIALLALLLSSAVPVRAQPVASLPAPDLPEGAGAADYLRAAQGAVAAGRTGQAEEALEMAQTRLLDRSVPLFQTQTPSDSPAVAQIASARDALRSGDREGCLRLIQAAMASLPAR